VSNSKAAEPQSYPVFLVAAEGGGIRASVMTAMVLDELRLRYADFTNHLYAIIGVSGGSIGAASFVAALRDGMPAVMPHEALYSRKLPDGRLNRQACLHVDLLSPTARALLGSDLLSQFVPTLFDLSSWDRARRFRKSLERRL
jgi:hypothetical protein